MEKSDGRIEAGQYLYASWGYDQTNIDFIKVVRVSPTEKTAICRRARGVYVKEESSPGQDALKPGEPFGTEFRLHVRDGFNDGDKVLRGKYPFCCDADPTALRMGQFYPWKKEIISQTAAGYGH